jgi:hypothetical protein
MNEISATCSGLPSSVASQAGAESQNQLQEAVTLRVLADSLAFQKSVAAELLKSMGIGNNLDLEI